MFFIIAGLLVVLANLFVGRIEQMLITRDYKAEQAHEIADNFNFGCYVVATICLVSACVMEVICGKKALERGNYLSPYSSYEDLRKACNDNLFKKKYSLYQRITLDSYSEINVYTKHKQGKLTLVALIGTDELTEENSEQFQEFITQIRKNYLSENPDLNGALRAVKILCVYSVNRTTSMFKRLVNITNEQSERVVELKSGVSFDEGIVYITRLADRYEHVERGSRNKNYTLHLYDVARCELCKILGLKKNMCIKQTDKGKKSKI